MRPLGLISPPRHRQKSRCRFLLRLSKCAAAAEPPHYPAIRELSMARMTGIIFSDLGQAASFMALGWVQTALQQRLGFKPFPATLNVRPKDAADAQVWCRVRGNSAGISLGAANDGFCKARLYPIELV